MSSYDKVVKLACKPKAAPPKAKYIDPIIAATWSEGGAVHDVCKALSPRFREPNAIIVFKALIVLHTMIRNGATDNVLGYLSSHEVLHLSNVSAGNWEGYTAPQNLQNYAAYLDSRIRAYADLKHDAIRVQAETNRDMRMGDERSKAQSSGVSRSKTITGRKLRVMTVEKGLLRETKTVHKMIDTLVECRFYLDNLEDELTTAALRMLVKDLLILFQAGNEGVINVLEHYFEMSHVDAEEALRIYRHFCKQTEKVVEYLGVAKKLQNLLNVPIPNLKHAPVSLAGALQEYLDDPNFEQNRIEYRTNKEAADKGFKRPVPNGNKKTDVNNAVPPVPTLPSTSTASVPVNKGKSEPAVDFFQSIEETQPTMFNPQTNSPNTTYFQQQSTTNPFHLMQMMTGQPQVMAQPTGFAALTVTNPFGFTQQQQQQLLQPQPTGHRPFSSFLPVQPTGLPQQQPPALPTTGFLQPQATGSNPFRQSVLLPQTTGMAMFGVGAPAAVNGAPNNIAPALTSAPLTATGFAPFSGPSSVPPSSVPARPASTPLTSLAPSVPRAASPPAAQPVKTHQTGTKNPFGPIVIPAPPVPKPPTLMELAMGMNPGLNGASNLVSQPQSTQPNSAPSTSTGFSLETSALSVGRTDMSSVASSFAFSNTSSDPAKWNAAGSSIGSPTEFSKPSIPPFGSTFSSGPLSSQNTSTTLNGSSFSDSVFSSLSSQTTGATTISSAPSPGMSGLKPHLTGLSGLKPFKPTSSFGASLLESLPPIPGSAPTTPAATGTGPSFSVAQSGPPTSALGGLPASNPGSKLGVGLRPQITGGAANPFRASMMGLPTGSSPGIRGPLLSGLSPSATQPVVALSGLGSPPSLGSNLFGSGNFGQSVGQQPQQAPNAATASLF